MKYVRIILDPNSEAIHPLHEFTATHDSFTNYRLLHWNLSFSDENMLLFHVDGDVEAYSTAAEEATAIIDYETSVNRDSSFYVCTRERFNDTYNQLTEAFSQTDLIVIPPINYRADRTIHGTIVGTAAAVDTAFETTPTGYDIEIVQVGDYAAHRLTEANALTDRQYEAVETAVETGYYESPRMGTVTEVAESIGCATGTAAEHLRKAEQTIMRSVVSETITRDNNP